MQTILDFFILEHDFELVVLAALVCLVSSFACVGLLKHARKSTSRKAVIVWTTISALAVGFGIWSTHFVSMLAFQPGFELSYDLWLTLLSLVIAISLCGAGIAFAIRTTKTLDHFLGGAVVGVAISTMHYTGIFALVLGGNIIWQPELVATSILGGILFGGFAFVSAMGDGRWRILQAAGLLTLAICVLHFTAMAAADFSQCFAISTSSGLHVGWLSLALAVISMLLVMAALISIYVDERDSRRTVIERAREQADAQKIAEATSRLELAMHHMAQGLGLFDKTGTLTLYNQRLAQMLGVDEQFDLKGMSFESLFLHIVSEQGAPAEEASDMADQLVLKHTRLIEAGGGEILHTLNDQRVLRINHSIVGDGSWVTTVDDITERQRTEAAIAHLARHDGLTNLPNRAMFDEHFEAALQMARDKHLKLAVIAIDLNRFKEINDSFGHAAGDIVLKNLAKRLVDATREGETVARLGGDEFGAIKLFSSIEAVRDLVSRLEASLIARLEVGDSYVNTSGSLGIAIYPDDATDKSKLLNNADLAMYRAKQAFDQNVCYYESEMDEQHRLRRDLARDIWAAVEQDAFYLAYQVQKSVATGQTTGYEVLLRWDRPGFGNISPADFIPVAEECGAIGAIGAWVLKMACLEAASWPEPHKIAVNISAVQLANLELIDTVRHVLDLSGLPPERLELEVTETSIIADKQRALHILRQIKTMGVSIAIDDFGTGYSSLDTLRSFPFDKIKLDRTFMSEVETNEQSKAFVRAILALGRSLQVPVLAEGVETKTQLDVLRAEGCTEAQGYLLGRPGAIDWGDEKATG
jgi:diguanylate cyclase (GGDEF)-like protein/PAS domain S-box-containing protein